MIMRFRTLLGALVAAVAFPLSAAIPATEQVQVIEFYHSGLDHYFISANAAEISDLDKGVHPGWTRTGYEFPAVKAGSTQAGSLPVCRFYGAKISSHFYTASAAECEDVKVKFPEAWTFESPEVFRTFPIDSAGNCASDTTPVYRLWNNRADVNHRYADQLAVFQNMVAKGYVPEGAGNPAFPVIFCVPKPGSVAPPPSAAAPNCTVTASSGTPALGTNLALNATCTNNPTSFMWAGCTSTTSSCTATQSTAGSKAYTLYSSNAAGPAAPVTINVNWGGGSGGGGVLPICTVSASTLTPTNGSPLTLTATCSQSPNQFDWMECNYLVQQVCNVMPACASSVSSCTINSNQPGYARYAIAASNNAGTGPRAPIDVEWKQGSGGGGGGPGGGGGDPIPSCTLFSSNQSPLINDTIVLSASCTGNPTSFFWTGLSGACTGIQCGTTSAVAGTQTYSVSASNATGTGGVAYIAVDWKSNSSPTPSCTLTASNPSPLLGTTITISSFCTNSPTTYVWTGCTSNSASCNDSVATAGTKNYTLIATNGAGSGPVANVAVNWTAPPTSPPVCSISASSTQPTVGQTVTLSASCNGAPTAFNWTNCTSSTSTCGATATAAGAQTYYVAATNQFGTGAAAGVVINWQAAGGGGGGGGGGLCSAYSNVITQPISWGDNGRYLTASMGGFSANGVIVFQFVVPITPTSYGTAGNTSIAEYAEPPTFRQMTLSKSACDFRPVDISGANGPLMMNLGNTALIDFNVGVKPVGLEPGQTYYMNFRNYSPDLPGNGVSCFYGTCNAAIVTNWPR
jgi:hypothetical protein